MTKTTVFGVYVLTQGFALTVVEPTTLVLRHGPKQRTPGNGAVAVVVCMHDGQIILRDFFGLGFCFDRRIFVHDGTSRLVV